MNFLLIFPHYISWHYTRGLSDLIRLCKNIIWFIWNFFSIKVFLKTLLSPFKRLDVRARNKFSVEDVFSALVTNMLMRILGFILRSFFIVLGLSIEIIFIVAALVFFIVWLLVPFILLAMLVAGFIAMIKIKRI